MNRLHGEKQSWTNRTQCIRNVLPFHFDRNDCTKMLEHWTKKKMAKLIERSSLGGTNRQNDISTQFWEHFHCRWISEWWLIWSVWIFAYRQSMRTFSKPLIGGLVKRKSVDFFINRKKFEWCGRYGNRARIITFFDLFTKRYAIFCSASSSLPNPYHKC